jgi:hypothetical protein
MYIFGGFCSYKTKKKITYDGPIKKPFSPFRKEKGAMKKKRKNMKDYIKLYIKSPKLIGIPRSWNFMAIHVLQSVRTGP